MGIFNQVENDGFNWAVQSNQGEMGIKKGKMSLLLISDREIAFIKSKQIKF